MRFSRKSIAGAGAVVAALLLASVAAQAKQLLEVNLLSKGTAKMFDGEKVDTERGPGWRSSSTKDSQANFDAIGYKFTPGTDIDLAKGTIEISVMRSRAGGPKWDKGSTYNTLFSILGPDDKRLLVVYILWEFRGNHAVSGIFVDSGDPNPWGRWIPFDRKIGMGEWVDLKFSWGPGNTRILLDGVEVPAYYSNYDGVKNKPNKPIVAGTDVFDLSGLKDATEIIIGSDIDYKRDKEAARKGSFGLYNSVLGKFVITDESSSAGPTIASIENNAARVAGFSGALVAGNTFTVDMQGTPGAVGSFDLAHFTDMSRSIALDWKGYGVYLEEKRFFEPDEVNLRDVNGYQVFVSKQPIDLSAPGLEPAVKLDVKAQSYTLEALDVDTAYYVAVLAEMRDGTLRPVLTTPTNLPMTETGPGVYTGTYQAGWQDRFPKAVVVGRLGSGTEAASVVDTAAAFAVDPSLNISVTTEPGVLKADEKSTSNVTVTVTNKNGDAVVGHKIKYLLATTSQYTGVVGGGAFAEQVGGTLTETRYGETDISGQITVAYVAGFAAKTAIIVARDMLSNSTGAGYVKTFIQATAQLELEPVVQSAAMNQGYAITVTSSDEWLTADGKSQARITARVTLGDEPVEGHQVDFSVSSGTGSIRTVKDVTDKNGEARAVYTAGKKIGITMIVATDTTVGISGTVAIELRSDAPAKIAIKIDPEKLPADGRSRADLAVLVTDINDNPNDNVEVEYRIASGSGNLQDDKGLTDRNGESSNRYTAGRTPGTVSIEITVHSTTPTEEELGKARDLALVVTDYNFF